MHDSRISLDLDPYGNYFLQRLVEHLSKSQLRDFIGRAKTRIAEMCYNLHGSCTLFKVIQEIKNSADLTCDFSQALLPISENMAFVLL